MTQIKRDKEICSECQSEFYSASSEMENLCPECAFYLYKYKIVITNFKTEDV